LGSQGLPLFVVELNRIELSPSPQLSFFRLSAEVFRGLQDLIEQAVEAEFAGFLGSHADLKLLDGRQRVVRHGHDPVRPIQTGIGR
jgi:hypothetical protein